MTDYDQRRGWEALAGAYATLNRVDDRIARDRQERARRRFRMEVVYPGAALLLAIFACLMAVIAA